MKIVKPEQQGFDSKRLYQIHETTSRRIKEKSLSCAASIVCRNGEVVWYDLQGLRDIENNIPLEPNTLFRIASMTKPITAVAVLIQMEKGKLRLTDPISNFLPYATDFSVHGTGKKANNNIRILDLLTHSAGVGSGDFFIKRRLDVDPKPNETLSEVVPRYLSLPLEFEPRTTAHYSGNASHDVLAHIVELTAQMPFEDFLKKYIFKPLQMENTTFHTTEEQKARLSRLYNNSNIGKLKQHDENDSYITRFPESYTSGGAGLFGTIEDYLKFAQMLLNCGEFQGKRILAPNTAKLISQPFLDEKTENMGSKGITWGLSVRVITSSFQDAVPLPKDCFGWSGAFGTHFWIDQCNKLIGIYFSNMTVGGGAEGIRAAEFENDVMQALICPAE